MFIFCRHILAELTFPVVTSNEGHEVIILNRGGSDDDSDSYNSEPSDIQDLEYTNGTLIVEENWDIVDESTNTTEFKEVNNSHVFNNSQHEVLSNKTEYNTKRNQDNAQEVQCKESYIECYTPKIGQSESFDSENSTEYESFCSGDDDSNLNTSTYVTPFSSKILNKQTSSMQNLLIQETDIVQNSSICSHPCLRVYNCDTFTGETNKSLNDTDIRVIDWERATPDFYVNCSSTRSVEELVIGKVEGNTASTDFTDVIMKSQGKLVDSDVNDNHCEFDTYVQKISGKYQVFEESSAFEDNIEEEIINICTGNETFPRSTFDKNVASTLDSVASIYNKNENIKEEDAYHKSIFDNHSYIGTVIGGHCKLSACSDGGPILPTPSECNTGNDDVGGENLITNCADRQHSLSIFSSDFESDISLEDNFPKWLLDLNLSDSDQSNLEQTSSTESVWDVQSLEAIIPVTYPFTDSRASGDRAYRF